MQNALTDKGCVDAIQCVGLEAGNEPSVTEVTSVGLRICRKSDTEQDCLVGAAS